MRRVVIVGNSGSGKTTLGDELAARLALGRIELDALFHGPDWTPTPADEFRAALGAALARADTDHDGWVACGNYSVVRPVLWPRADTIVWLDYSRAVVMTRVVRRSVTRAAAGTELWNGNRERWANLLALHDPQRSIVRWSWDGVRNYRTQLGAVWGDPGWGAKHWVHLRSPRATQRWLAVVAVGCPE